ncbi:putative amino acid transporter, transmembrane domain-containing protein [Helianthus annuus]|uniref:Amino acid transporter, transmembrane domain-containing protein n=1 Tax=Helianthus annuus TaxID=4232 RepID=A0A9K3EHV2_HELAN|nr:putative amino acid transporter, transmembrane domain-containing protein [Helianthus annuus]KAJ0481857.1 putative amino acid transporter, transmembrane domain-containing protein [Helianthus annuus]KAJ0498234.1 putative amino acid transporter, transmembrane domain-containing protein [Helianthus annuus]KAJ0664237.1 putative amino acid transporter, transmembrane domain-containing protein [Helianthus annuus]KAJ0671709.1 putative amino acid transporter, transmembrane domain-containing protein [He
MMREQDDYVHEEQTPMLQLSDFNHKSIDLTVERKLLPQVSTTDDHKITVRTGTLWSSVAHIITAVIGSGVLSLAWSVSKLGWIGGPVALLFFAVVTYVSSSLLSDCYRSPDPVNGVRNRSFADAVRVILGCLASSGDSGEKQALLCGILQFVNFYGTGVAYVVTTATCMSAIQRSNCYHNQGHEAPCEYEGNLYMFLFGVVQIVMSQIPDFHSMMWISIVAAIMSFCYSSIGFGLGIAKVIENGKIEGGVYGASAVTAPAKLWLTFQAIGDVAFAYPYSLVFLEIQDTLKSTPPENKVMRKASLIAILVTTFFYLGCGCFGYAAFGDNTPGNLLTGFGFYEPYWLIDFANACIILHLIGGYQLFSQPVYAYAERWVTEKFPDSILLKNTDRLKLPLLPDFELNLFRLCFRTSYVVSTTGIALVFPYFNEILGLLGALNLWPLAIYFPVEMYIVQRKVETWSRKWVVLQIFSSFLMVVSVAALMGSVAGLIEAKTS